MKTNLFILLLALPLLSFAADDSLFHNGSYLSAKKLASKHNKLRILEFVAEWCLPCKHMDQTTFRDDQVKAYLKANYIPLKVDIDQFDGFALKETFEVRYLPTFIVIDPDGKVVKRFEEALNPEEFLIAIQIDQEETMALPIETGPESISEDLPLSAEESISEDVVQDPEYHFIQFGVFGNEVYAKKLYDDVLLLLPSDPEIVPFERNGETLFKVQYGPFSDLIEAEEICAEIRNQGYSALLKKLE